MNCTLEGFEIAFCYTGEHGLSGVFSSIVCSLAGAFLSFKIAKTFAKPNKAADAPTNRGESRSLSVLTEREGTIYGLLALGLNNAIIGLLYFMYKSHLFWFSPHLLV